jgi:serine kinase of HPr protein (carbohydrate metabolism regulator)
MPKRYFLKSLSPHEQTPGASISLLRLQNPVRRVFSRDLKPDRQFLRAAEAAEVPIFRCPLITMKFINLATSRWR